MNTFGEKVTRAPWAASRRAAACSRSSATGDVEQRLDVDSRVDAVVDDRGHVREATRHAPPPRRVPYPVQNWRGRVMWSMSPSPPAARTPSTLERGVGDLPPVGDEPPAVDRRELVEVAAPVVEPVHGEEQVVGARPGRRLAQHVDLRGGGEVPDERDTTARDPLLGGRHDDRLARAGGRSRATARHDRRHERMDGLASLVAAAARLHDAVGSEHLDHLVDATTVAVGVVAGDAVADALARDELPHFHGLPPNQPSAAGSTNHTTRSAST